MVGRYAKFMRTSPVGIAVSPAGIIALTFISQFITPLALIPGSVLLALSFWAIFRFEDTHCYKCFKPLAGEVEVRQFESIGGELVDRNCHPECVKGLYDS